MAHSPLACPQLSQQLPRSRLELDTHCKHRLPVCRCSSACGSSDHIANEHIDGSKAQCALTGMQQQCAGLQSMHAPSRDSVQLIDKLEATSAREEASAQQHDCQNGSSRANCSCCGHASDADSASVCSSHDGTATTPEWTPGTPVKITDGGAELAFWLGEAADNDAALVVVLWAAPWLHNAERVAGNFAAAARQHPGALFLEIDVLASDANKQLAFEKVRASSHTGAMAGLMTLKARGRRALCCASAGASVMCHAQLALWVTEWLHLALARRLCSVAEQNVLACRSCRELRAGAEERTQSCAISTSGHM